MAAQLAAEFKIVAQVREHVGNVKWDADLQSPFAIAQDETSATAASVTNAVQRGIEVSGDDSVAEGMIDILGGAFCLASSILAPEAELAVEVAYLSSAGSLLDVAGGVVSASDGSNPLVGEIEAKASELSTEATQNYGYAVIQYSHIADLIVSDWGKLQRSASWGQPRGRMVPRRGVDGFRGFRRERRERGPRRSRDDR
jgi:hypothetical protein